MTLIMLDATHTIITMDTDRTKPCNAVSAAVALKGLPIYICFTR
jgi:hypothetical protein